jgi:hypothetical protein
MQQSIFRTYAEREQHVQVPDSSPALHMQVEDSSSVERGVKLHMQLFPRR